MTWRSLDCVMIGIWDANRRSSEEEINVKQTQKKQLILKANGFHLPLVSKILTAVDVSKL
jgi:hypothetical protein